MASSQNDIFSEISDTKTIPYSVEREIKLQLHINHVETSFNA